MRPARHLSVVLILGFAACGHVETAPGLQLTPTEQQGLESAVKYAGFWNPGCDPRHIVVQRVDDTRTLVELSVCGEARRYQSLTPAQWVDVTYATQARPDAGLKSPKLGAD